MARRGDQARQDVMNKILNTFDSAFVQDKKIYVSAIEGGEAIQFAISLTMPKTPVAVPTGETGFDAAGNHDFNSAAAKPVIPTQTQASPEDEAKVEELMKRLGITDETDKVC